MDPEAMRTVARRAAEVGGRVVRAAARPATGDAKGAPGDWVTEVDLASEHAIRAYLRDATPDVPMHGEETGGATEGLRWVVDPLDGTTNFLHGFPAVGVSVALVEGKEVVAGAIEAPFLGDRWHAARGGGAAWEHADGSREPCVVSARPVEQAVVATGFPFRRKELVPRHLAAVAAVLGAVEDLRRPGAACLDLAWVACGVFDGFFELALAAWDVAAGGLLIREAGGRVTDWEGAPDYLTGDILAGSPPVWETLRRATSA